MWLLVVVGDLSRIDKIHDCKFALVVVDLAVISSTFMIVNSAACGGSVKDS